MLCAAPFWRCCRGLKLWTLFDSAWSEVVTLVRCRSRSILPYVSGLLSGVQESYTRWLSVDVVGIAMAGRTSRESGSAMSVVDGLSWEGLDRGRGGGGN
jgi:hypothetical protein